MADEVKALMCAKLLRVGLSEKHAQTISSCLTETSLYGIDTHGIRLFSYYVKELEQGRANRSPEFVYSRESAVSGLLDADNANGIIAGVEGMRYCVAKCKTVGLSAVVVNNSNHFGAASTFSRLAAKEKLIGISLSNSDALVALEGGCRPFLGTNPIAVSIPGAEGAKFDLDFATSQTAYSKVMKYLAEGTSLPSGWALDEQGNDSVNSQKVHALMPLGGYKGQGLGLMVQMLTCVLAGMPFDHQLDHLYSPPYDSPRKIAHFFIAIDPSLFMDAEQYGERVKELLFWAKENTPNAILPGEKEMNAQKKRDIEGIPLSEEEQYYFEMLRKEVNCLVSKN
ncbi:Ldh family oxidoreductase [Pseudoalteromonas maricaloris]|uniref:Ldh family oxidoreductase n=1 Tax=Pseudoalteromonas maricaloris TaxID=184924 RepID=UPI003C17F009